jgi:hypothetical protein
MTVEFGREAGFISTGMMRQGSYAPMVATLVEVYDAAL